jgi:triphosphoribosyl-dephospho-CoA synthase
VPDCKNQDLTPRDIAALAQLACLLEASAPKPGNVSPGRSFADLRYEDFVASAIAIGQPFEDVGIRPLGHTIRLAVEATARWTSTNTNLGMILLLAPLAKAMVGTVGIERWDLGVFQVLSQTTVDDAREVYKAIRLARPGGLGRVDSQDVADEPQVTLLEAMRLAADRDGVASEYATGFEVTRTIGAPAMARARRDGLSWDDAIVETFLHLLASRPDTHIVRRTGAAAAERVSSLARHALEVGGVRSAAGRRAVADMDAGMRDSRNSNNPGTTADLTAAAIFSTLVGWDFGPPEGGPYVRSVRL